jgi:ribosomal protein S18 acetylase RimI-like enzyme
MDAHPLDNPVWNSLSAAHLSLAELAAVAASRAGRYQRDVCPFGALADPRETAAWWALDQLLEGQSVVLIIDADQVRPDWEIIREIPGVQMDGTGLEPGDDPDLRPLQPADVPEMLALVERTRPGPFLPRTIEMGTYLGLRQEGALVAMAGERLRPAGWTELSAVCTDAAFQGRGLGTRLVRAIAMGIRARHERPFLHAAAANETAIRLYRALGFEVRRPVSFLAVRKRAG